MKRLFVFLIAFFLCVVFASCSHRLIDFTIISSKNVDLSQMAQFKRGTQRVEGIDKVHIIIFIPTGTPNAKEALDKAIESVPGAVALVDGVITQKFWWIPYIYGQNYFVVEGTPIINPDLLSNIDSQSKSNYMVATLDEKGNFENLNYVSEDEYNIIKEKAVN